MGIQSLTMTMINIVPFFLKCLSFKQSHLHAKCKIQKEKEKVHCIAAYQPI